MGDEWQQAVHIVVAVYHSHWTIDGMGPCGVAVRWGFSPWLLAQNKPVEIVVRWWTGNRRGVVGRKAKIKKTLEKIMRGFLFEP
jgi:hypothetical protein